VNETEKLFHLSLEVKSEHEEWKSFLALIFIIFFDKLKNFPFADDTIKENSLAE